MGIDNEALVTLLMSAMIEEKQETPNIEENRAKPCSSNGNIDNRSVATVLPVSTNGNNNEGETPIIPETKQTTKPNNDNKVNGFVASQFSSQHKKENKRSFYTSLSIDTVGVVITGVFIAAAVMVPSVAGAIVCGVAAILVAVITGLHIVNSTLPSYREMRENKVEPVNPITQTL